MISKLSTLYIILGIFTYIITNDSTNSNDSLELALSLIIIISTFIFLFFRELQRTAEWEILYVDAKITLRYVWEEQDMGWIYLTQDMKMAGVTVSFLWRIKIYWVKSHFSATELGICYNFLSVNKPTSLIIANITNCTSTSHFFCLQWVQ
jgi:hypothetical protein